MSPSRSKSKTATPGRSFQMRQSVPNASWAMLVNGMTGPSGPVLARPVTRPLGAWRWDKPRNTSSPSGLRRVGSTTDESTLPSSPPSTRWPVSASTHTPWTQTTSGVVSIGNPDEMGVAGGWGPLEQAARPRPTAIATTANGVLNARKPDCCCQRDRQCDREREFKRMQEVYERALRGDFNVR